ncbi:MAG TPA: DNA internalization-related competence protein ComEC/Rec2 [Longimicrobiaceae bacterium]|nr:DNA internalization-related competence protein ComEC/Rec2 [Longimicrobiaceae bacterium]
MIRALRPLVLATLAFLLGLLPALRFAPRPLPLAAVAVAAVFFLPALRRTRHAARAQAVDLLFAVALAAAALGAEAARSAASDCRAHLPDGARVIADGRLASTAFPADATAGQPILTLTGARVVMPHAVCTGEVRVRLAGVARPLRAGSRVRLAAAWLVTSGPVLSSSWPRPPERSGYLAADSVELLAGPGGAPLLALRGAVELGLHRLFPGHFALVDALFLGRRERVDDTARQEFANAGLAHLLAISGMHVGILAGVVLLLGGVLRLPRRWVVGGSLALLGLYLVLIGAPASAVRAGIMIALALVARLIQRPSAALPMIAAAALAILAISPLSALSAGFQLSFVGVLGVIGGMRLLPRHRLHSLPPFLRGTVEATVVSIAAFLATAPVTAWHFGVLAPVSVLASLPAVPLMSLALVGVLLALALLPALPAVARLVADGTGVALDAMRAVAHAAARLPYGHLAVTRPDTTFCIAALLVALAAYLLTRRLRPAIRAGVAGLAVLSVALAWPALARARGAPLEIFFIDVGQGDAIAIRTPGDRWILVDAGPKSPRFDAGERRVLPFLRAHGAHRLEALVLSHPDADHIGGAAAVLRGIPVGRVIEPGLPVAKPAYEAVLAEVERQHIPWSAERRGRTLSLDGVRLDFLWPTDEMLDRAEESNEISGVIRLKLGQFSAILTGDAPADVEARLVELEGSGLRAQVLKAGHHGSSTSSSEVFLRAVRPQLVVISVGRHNRYGHPSPVVLGRLHRLGIPVARTDLEGTVAIRVDPSGSGDWRRE